MEADGSGSDVPGTGRCNLEIGGSTQEAEHELDGIKTHRSRASRLIHGFELSLLLFEEIVTRRR